MLEKLHLNEVSGTSLSEVFGKLLEKIPGWEQVSLSLGKISTVLFAIGIVLALLQCFLGYKIKKYWTGIDGLFVFGATGAAIAFYYELGTGAIIGIAIGAGFVGALLGYFLWFVGCFFRALFFTSILAFSIFASLDMAVLGLIVGLAAGLIAGILEAAFNKPFLLAYTSMAGAWTAVFFLTELAPVLAEPWFIPVIVGTVFSVAGIVFQALTNRKKRESPSIQETPDEEIAAQDAAPETEREKESAEPLENAEAAEIATSEGASEKEPENPEKEIADAAQECSNPKEEPVDSAQEFAKPAAVLPQDFVNSTEEIKETAGKAVQEISQPEQKKCCPNCGAECRPDAKFCMKCGQKL